MHDDRIRAAFDHAGEHYLPTATTDPADIVARGRRIRRRRRSATAALAAAAVIGILTASVALLRQEPLPPAVPGPLPTTDTTTTTTTPTAPSPIPSPTPLVPEVAPGVTPSPHG